MLLWTPDVCKRSLKQQKKIGKTTNSASFGLIRYNSFYLKHNSIVYLNGFPLTREKKQQKKLNAS